MKISALQKNLGVTWRAAKVTSLCFFCKLLQNELKQTISKAVAPKRRVVELKYSSHAFLNCS